MAVPNRNLLFVTVDCLRQDFVRGEFASTPFIDSLRSDGIEWTDLYSTTTTTTPAVASLFTGAYSETNGVHSLREAELDESVETLAERFMEHGYETAAMVTGPLVPETGLDRGFDNFWYRESDEHLVGDWFATAVDRLENLSEPYFAYVHLWEIHDPVTVPDEFDTDQYGERPYMRGLSAVDAALEELVTSLSTDPVVAIHGDHGESISWRDSHVRDLLKSVRRRLRYNRGIDTRPFERLLNRLAAPFDPSYPDHFLEEGHGETVYDPITNVPFVLSDPELDATEVSTQTRQIDILPTILDLFDIPVPEGIDGRSARPSSHLDDRSAYIRACGESLFGRENWQRAVRADGYKYVEYPNREWRPEIYDLESDPDECEPIGSGELVAELQHHFPTEQLGDAEDLGIDDRLEDLGYL